VVTIKTDNDLLTMLAMKVDQETDEDALKAKQDGIILSEYFNQQRTALKNPPHVVMVGGGIISLMTALFLSEYGVKLTIIEAQSFGAAASGRNGGAIMTLGRELSEIAFSKYSVELWSTLESLGVDTKYEKNGHLMVGRNQVENEKLQRAFELYQKAGIKVEMLNHNQMKEHVPHLNPDIKVGLFSYDDAMAYPFSTIQSIIRILKSKGATLISHTPVKGFVTKDSKITAIQTEQDEIHGDYFLVSTGPWTEPICSMLGEVVKIRPRRSQIFATEIMKAGAVKPFFTGNGIYLRQTHAGNVIFGGGGPWEIDGYEVENTMQAIELQSNRFLELFPDFHTKKLLRSFAGTVELTADHLPALSSFVKYTNGFVSAGYNGHGFGLSAVMGKTMSSLMYDHMQGIETTEDMTEVLNPLSIKRFLATE
jgi:sarcosine oxidase subunit beta